jgi:putative redox protein
MRRPRARHDRAAAGQARHHLVGLALRVSADKIDKFDLGPITEAYDIELPPGDDEAAEVFAAVAHRVDEKYCTVGRAQRGGAETIQMLPGSPPATEA